MENVLFLIKGLLIGLSIAAPVGPIGVLCIRRTLERGLFSGLVSGLGAATADAFYGAVAGFGLAFVSNFLIRQQLWLRLIGGVFLIGLGIKIFLSKPSQDNESAEQNAAFGDYASTFFLTLTNPTTILSFAAIFAGLGLGSTNGSYLSASVLVIGVFSGSALWWLILSGGVNALRRRLNEEALVWVNRVSASIIFAFGLIALAGVLRR
jgi:threonine/homoserine/homoserine lactone efflux protein